MNDFLLEICCGSAEDAIAAYEGGAKRVELNSDLFHGGLTPTLGALRTVKARCPDLRVMCMVRPREGGFCYSDVEYEVMKQDAKAFLESGADGIVFGFLHADGTVDEERTREMVALIGDKEKVFHRAIDVTPDVFAALDVLKRCGVTRVLTSGQEPTVPEGLDTIRKMMEYTGGHPQILPGGGITPKNAAFCRKALNIGWLHAAIHRDRYDRSTDGNTAIYFGGAIYPPEDRHSVTHAADVRMLLQNAMAESTD